MAKRKIVIVRLGSLSYSYGINNYFLKEILGAIQNKSRILTNPAHYFKAILKLCPGYFDKGVVPNVTSNEPFVTETVVWSETLIAVPLNVPFIPLEE